MGKNLTGGSFDEGLPKDITSLMRGTGVSEGHTEQPRNAVPSNNTRRTVIPPGEASQIEGVDTHLFDASAALATPWAK